MKKLIFIRHGRAEDPVPEIPDYERSLTIKGKIISRTMAAKLKKAEDSPGLMITSPAFRALETAIIFASEYGIKPEMISMKSDLYFKSDFHSLQRILTEAGEDNDSITLFGHNPSFTEIPAGLTMGGCDFVPKSGVVCISFKINKWSEIKQNSGKLEYFLRPDK